MQPTPALLARSGIARAALVIGLLTVLSRIGGFGRILVFARTVGTNCLGDTYQAVNAVPNIAFEVVAGGALAGAVVPVLAHAVERDDRVAVDRAASALLCWAVLVLSVVAVAVAVFAAPIAAYLLAAKPCGSAATAVGAGLLRIFAAQIPLYGVGVVVSGVLQAHRRFAGPALAPLLSSLIAIGTYLAYAALAGPVTGLGAAGPRAGLALGIGTTAAVAVLSGTLLAPLARTPVRLRPTLRFPAGVAGRVLRLTGAGLAALLAQQAAMLAALKLGNGAGVPAGQYAGFTYVQTVALLPWAVLALPVATAAFPWLAQAHDAGDIAAYAAGISATIRSVVVVSLLGAALLAAAAGPIARVVVGSAATPGTARAVAAGITAAAPGVVGYGLFALLSRALYGAGRARSVTVVAATGWCAVVLADIALAVLLPPEGRLRALAAGASIGMVLLGAASLCAVRRHSGPAALAGVARTACGGLAAAVAAAAAGRLVTVPLSGGGSVAAGAQAVLSGAVVLAVFATVGWVTMGGDMRRLLAPAGRRRG